MADPDKTLGKGWQASPDRAVTSAADSDGVHVLVADGKDAYTWRTAAVLSEPGLPADTWIGNQCVVDPSHVAVVYAPRSFTNHQDLMLGGAFAAVVDIDKDTVTKLPFTASLAYFDPSCNPTTRTAAFTAFRDGRTRLITVDTAGRTVANTTASGQVTSAVPVADGTVAAAGHHVVHIDRSGRTRNLTTTDSVPFDIRPAAKGGIAFLDRTDTTAHAKVLSSGRIATIATGDLADLSLEQAGTSTVFLTGHPKGAVHTAGTGVTRIDAPADTDVSTHGRLAVDPVLSPGVRAGLDRIAESGRQLNGTASATEAAPADGTGPLTVTATATATGEKVTETVTAPITPAGADLSPALTGTPSDSKVRAASLTADHDPVDTDRWCSVPRNDVNQQALQPTPNQVEWAVDMAVRGDLTSGWVTQGGWRSQIGLGTIDPQGLFPVPSLTGGGRIPAQVELGILAQESNLWQAESGAIPGQMGNPLAATAGFYGHTGTGPSDYWKIDWTKSDCGYGVGQVTDGMRMAGHEKPGETALPPTVQKAVALDYTVNIAASLQILADKWNEVHTPGQTITVNNDDPSKPENWFTAVWNYNLGFNPPSGAPGVPWGLGWYNNPANPLYPPSRLAFMDTTLDPGANHDAAHPQDWPYEEKVMGWAAWSIDTGHSYATSGRQDWPGESGFASAGFQPSWWLTNQDRSDIKPPLDTFCTTANACDISNPPPCETQQIDGCDQLHWWNTENTVWKPACADTCGHESIKYQTLRAEPGRGTRLQYGTPDCTAAPAGSFVVDSDPAGTQTWSDCGTVSSQGTFQFTFYPDTAGQYEAKGDLHQIGGGYQGHFWYAHDRDTAHLGGDSGPMTILGDWKLNSPLPQDQAQVYVHIPDTGAQTKEADYQIVTPFGTVNKTIAQDTNASNTWVSLGAYNFHNQPPEVELSNSNGVGTGNDDVAWDAVAFVPGDYSGMPEVDFPAEDPNAPDIDFLARQTPKAVSAPTPIDALSTPVAAKGAYTPLGTHGVSRRSTAGTPSARTAAVASEPVPWCKAAAADYETTRTEGCLRGAFPMEAQKTDGTDLGAATMKIIQEIKLDPNSGTFTTWTELSLINMTGIESTTLDTFIENCWAQSECHANPGGWSGSTTWTKGDTHTATRTNTYTWNTVAGGASTLSLDWNTDWSTPGGIYTANQEWKDTNFDARCDNQVGGNVGCVFPKYTPTLPLNKAKYPAAAAYYWVLMEKLATHPGSEKYHSPLHRLADDALVKTYREKMCVASVAEWNPNPLAMGTSCDEYPFARSRESGGQTLSSGKYCVQIYGALKSGGGFTLNLDLNYPTPSWNEVCGRAAIPASQNINAGGDLGRFTSSVRLLDNDGYYVETGYEGCSLSSVCSF